MGLATVEDYERLTGTDVPDGAETDRVQALLDAASGSVKRYTRQTIELATTDEAFCLELARPTILLREVPIIEAAPPQDLVVTGPDGEVVPRDHYSVEAASGQLKHCDCRPWAVGDYVVHYTHGFEPIPADLIALVCGAVQGVVGAPAGVASQSVGSYSVTFREGADVAGLAGIGGAILDDYRVPTPPIP